MKGSSSGSATAKKAAALLVHKKGGFVVPTSKQKKNLVVAFARRNMIIYGRAFDIIRLSGVIDLNDAEVVERNLDKIVVFEIKSTRKNLAENFNKFFFALTGAEVLVAQSLKHRFKFIFVNINTGNYLELSLNEVFARARGVYPTWSIMF